MEIDLEIQQYIDQARRMTVGEMEPLFWVVEDGLAAGNIQRAKGAYALLLYAAKYNPRLVAQGLQAVHRSRLQELTYEMFGGASTKKREAIVMKPPISPVPLPFQKERELQSYLVAHKEVLSKALNDDIRVVGTEVEIDGGYRCDIAVEGKQIFYPVELKIVQATHQVVSQANKYVHFFYRQLRYNFFRMVRGVVICNGADAWSINELRREGLWVFTIRPSSKEDIILDRVS